MAISVEAPQPILELYEGGVLVPFSGQYTLVDDSGKKHDDVIVKLNAGETFPAIPLQHLSYMLIHRMIQLSHLAIRLSTTWGWNASQTSFTLVSSRKPGAPKRRGKSSREISRQGEFGLAVVQGIQKRKFIPGSLIGVLTFHILAIAAFFTFSWPGFIAFLVMVFITGCLGITLGYHRLLTHRSFETPKPVKYLLAFFGCLALQGGPIRWVATHRLHHKEADKPNDPHSAEEGFLWSHLLWNFYRHPQLETAEDLHRYAPDMEKDPVLRFLDKYFFPLYLAVAALFFLAGTLVAGWQLGLSLVVWGCVLRVVYTWHITWLVNSATHMWGYQTFKTTDNSRNNWWVALLTFGEGWHNNHHAYQRSSRMGFAWYEVDVTFWIIKVLQRLGLARNLVDQQPSSKSLTNGYGKQVGI